MPRGGVPGREGHWCQHTVPKCANCRGPHFAQANACPKKKAARSDAKGWRSPPPKWRQRDEASPPEDPPTVAQETPGDRPEVEEEYEPASGEAMEEQGNGAGRGGAEAESFLRFSFSFSFLFSFVSAFGAQETPLWLATVCGRGQWSC